MSEPKVIHVVTPESSKGELWAEVQRLNAEYAAAARDTTAILRRHRELDKAKNEWIVELEKALTAIADHATQPPWAECARIARAAQKKKPEQAG